MLSCLFVFESVFGILLTTLTNLCLWYIFPIYLPYLPSLDLDLGKKRLMDSEDIDTITKKLKGKLC
jgi:hypothetical protein